LLDLGDAKWRHRPGFTQPGEFHRAYRWEAARLCRFELPRAIHVTKRITFGLFSIWVRIVGKK
jgi:hypothetical protein